MSDKLYSPCTPNARLEWSGIRWNRLNLLYALKTPQMCLSILSCFLNTTWRTPLSVLVFCSPPLLLLSSTPPSPLFHTILEPQCFHSVLFINFSAKWRSVAHNAAVLLGRIHVSWRFLSYCKHMITKTCNLLYTIFARIGRWQAHSNLHSAVTVKLFFKTTT